MRSSVRIQSSIVQSSSSVCGTDCLLGSDLLARGDGVRVQGVLESEEERSSDDTLGDLGADT
jgi:hypothetical protein